MYRSLATKTEANIAAYVLRSREQSKTESKVFTSSAAPVTPVRVAGNQDKVQQERVSEVSESNQRLDAYCEKLCVRPFISRYHHMIQVIANSHTKMCFAYKS